MIAIHDGDSAQSGFPNLALMKISAHYKRIGERVEWFNFVSEYDMVYSSAVFSFSKKESYLPHNAVCGGTGYSIYSELPEEIDSEFPDYSIYNAPFAVGFLTRGCPNKCEWCVVPKKEGKIRPYRTWRQIKRPDCRDIVFMDNNVLAHDHGISELESLISAKHDGKQVRIDFNQGLDARRIDKDISKILSKLLWYRPVRLACDTMTQLPYVERAVAYMREAKVTPSRYSCYVLVRDVEDALKRVERLREIGVDPFAQPYRDFSKNTKPEGESLAFARWVNQKAVFKTTTWKDYHDKRKGRV